MSAKDAYKMKIEAELEMAQAKLLTWKANAKDFSADAYTEFNKQVVELEQHLDSLKSMLKGLGEAGESAWDKLKDSMDNALDSLGKKLHGLADKFTK
jgi:ElaB/YqjD/DUF883 family membrane-anchored ribosome-binding protein